jgi:outer membrane protein assembly factor BamB
VGIVFLGALALPVAAAADGPAAFQVDAAHTGAAPGTTFAPPLGKKWVRRDLGEGASFPVLAEGRVFLTAGTNLYALDLATGATVWTRALRARGVAYDDGRVFAVDATGTMQALSAANGSVAWTTRLPGASSSISPPTAYGDFVYASSSSTLFGVNQDTGLVVWSSGAQAGERSVPAVDADKTYTSGGCGDVSSFERRTGVDVWHYDGECGGFVGSTTAVFGGQVFGSGVILDALTGLLRDTLPSTQAPAFAGNVAYVINGRELYARDNGRG